MIKLTTKFRGIARLSARFAGFSLFFLASEDVYAQPKTVILTQVRAKAPQPGIASNRVATPARYIVGPDDVLAITVLKHPEFSVASVIVPQNGLVTMPVVGTVRATGKTLEQLDAEITQGMRVKLRKPEITITLERPRPRPIYIVGQVKNPGIFEIKNNWRITQALAAAGGLSVDTDLAAVIVNRSNRKLADTPLLPLLKDPTNRGNVVLRSGDSLRFYERKVTVSVTGAVTRPGVYSVPIGSGIVQAVGLAGGSIPAAALTKASLRRANGRILPINLFKALMQNDAASNLPLVEGDVIVVPEQNNRVSVLGAVNKPGFLPLQDGRNLKIADAIALSGGPAPNAALTRAVLRRANGSQQQLNLYQLLVQGEQAANFTLGPDDIISIPESRGVTVIGEVEKPGNYPLEEGKKPRISDALAAAGGLKIKPELSRITVARSLPNGKTVALTIDPVSLLELSNPAQNSLTQDGDIISVSALKMTTVFISGEVEKPGAFQLAEGDGVVELVSRAGGPTPDAALSQVSVTRRDGSVTVVNTAAALLEGSNRIGGPLNDGDIVVVPRSKQRVLVVGAVTKPGSYALSEDRPLTIGDALSLAGGPLSSARVKTLTLLRPNGQAVTETVLRIDRAENGALAISKPVQNGDVIYVPEGRIRQSTLSSIASFLPAASVFLR